MLRAKSVMRDGPPITRSSQLAAALSLRCTAATHSSSMVMLRPTRVSVIGEFGRMSDASMVTASVRFSSPRAAFWRTRAAAYALNVEHIANASSARCATDRPLSRFSA